MHAELHADIAVGVSRGEAPICSMMVKAILMGSALDKGTRCVKLMPVIYNVLTRTGESMLDKMMSNITIFWTPQRK